MSFLRKLQKGKEKSDVIQEGNVSDLSGCSQETGGKGKCVSDMYFSTLV